MSLPGSAGTAVLLDPRLRAGGRNRHHCPGPTPGWEKVHGPLFSPAALPSCPSMTGTPGGSAMALALPDSAILLGALANVSYPGWGTAPSRRAPFLS